MKCFVCRENVAEYVKEYSAIKQQFFFFCIPCWVRLALFRIFSRIREGE